ncbi:MAG: helix-turn-helix domain-containing protein [Acidimicrobiaceae bacterium]|nr:helix-turn-helix domain-containing protein [Acidimicrobiaceae bacterium]
MTVTLNATRTSIDMYTPTQTCDQLVVSEAALLDLVNSGRLGAHNLGGNIRFKVADVHATAAELAAA